MATFISYSRVNSDFALRLAKDLKAAGLDVWLDQLDIPTGARWDDEIQKALDGSKTFLIILTPESIESQNVKDEVGYAIDAGKQILPVILKPCNVPFRIRRFQYVDFSNKPYHESLTEIKHLLSDTQKLGVIRDDLGTDEKDKESAFEPGSQKTTVEKKPITQVDRPIKEKSGGKLTWQVAAGVSVVVCIAAIGILYSLTSFIRHNPTSSADTTVIVTTEPVITVTTSVTVAAPENEITDSKGVQMVLVPAGPFKMGSNSSISDPETGEQYLHTVNLSAFYIDKYDVTNALYKACVDAGSCKPPLDFGSQTHSNYYGNTQFDDYPVVTLSWSMAKNYCVWRGGNLPTEAQWEKAARGTDGRTYPWGETMPDCNYANINGCVGDAIKVGSYEKGKSLYGTYDMAGNVWEWVVDWYQPQYYSVLGDNALNPAGPDNGDGRVIRGGAYFNTARSVRTTLRNHADPAKAYNWLGFRCVRPVP